MANSAHPDETPHSLASYLGLQNFKGPFLGNFLMQYSPQEHAQKVYYFIGLAKIFIEQFWEGKNLILFYHVQPYGSVVAQW